MSLNNLTKSVLVTIVIYVLAFAAVMWAPWDPSPNFTSVLDDFRRDQQIGAGIYQALVITFILLANLLWRPTYSGQAVCAILVLFVAPQWILEHYGTEKFFTTFLGAFIQGGSTATLITLIFEAKDERQPHIPA